MSLCREEQPRPVKETVPLANICSGTAGAFVRLMKSELDSNEVDNPYDHWEDCEIVAWLNEAIGVLYTVRSDLYTESKAITITGNCENRYDLPDDCTKMGPLLEILDCDGTPVQEMDENQRRLLRYLSPDMPGSFAACLGGNTPREKRPYKLQNVYYNPKVPGSFTVYPPLPAGSETSLTIACSKCPPCIECDDLESQQVQIPDCALAPIKFYVLSRAYGKDIESPAMLQLSESYLRRFSDLMELWAVSDYAYHKDNYYLRGRFDDCRTC